MKMKFITAVVAFSIAFGFSAFLANLSGANNRLNFREAENNQTAEEITAFLEQDIENGEEMDAACQSAASIFEYSEAIGEYADASEALEDVNLPPDLRFAWQAHMKAWRGHADFLASSVGTKDFYEKKTLQTYLTQRDEIKRTWISVLDISRKYSAIIPPNAY